MKSYIKIAFRNVKNNKLKYSLICIVFMLTIFASIFCTTFSDVAISTREDQLRNNTMNSQLSVITKDYENIYFDENIMSEIKKIDGVKEVCPTIYSSALYENKNIDFRGIDKDKQNEVYKFKYLDKIEDNSEDYIIVNKEFLKENSKKLGDKITLSRDDISISLKITGVVDNYDTLDNLSYISLDNAQKLLGEKGKVSTLNITIKSLDKIDEIYNRINKIIPNTLCSEKKYDLQDYKSYISTLTVAIGIFAIFSLIISILLCYSMYSSLIYQRIKIIGSYRSIGITKLGIYLSLFIEFIITVIPSIVLGVVLSYVFMNFMINNMFGSEMILNIDIIKIIFIGILITISGLISLCIAVRKILRMNVVELIKGNSEIKEGNKILKIIIEIAMVLASIIVYVISLKVNNLYLQYSNLILLLITFIVVGYRLASFFINILRIIFGKVYWKFNLLLKQIVGEIEKMRDSIILVILVISIASISMMVSKVIESSAINVYKGIDIIFNNLSVNENDEVNKSISNISDINKCVQVQRYSEDVNDKRITISGINPDEYKKISFEKYLSSSKDEMLNNLDNEEDNIIISKSYANYLKKDVGDHLKIDTINGKKKYKIIGLVSSFEDKGTIAFVSNKNFNKNFVADSISYFICVNSNSNINNTKKKIEDKIKDNVFYNISTLKEISEQNTKNNQTIFSIIDIVIGITLVVCTVCLINNLIVNIIKRKKIFAIKRSLGLDFKFIKNSIITEGAIIGLTSSLIGILLGYLLNKNILSILSYYIGDVENINVMPPFWFILIAIILVSICCSYPYRIIKKSNIVNLVKGDE